jgi:hypothetical protein
VVEPDEHEDDELPSKFLIFTRPDLDQNEDKAREAGEEIQDILIRKSSRGRANGTTGLACVICRAGTGEAAVRPRAAG